MIEKSLRPIKRTLTSAHAIVECMKIEGVKHVFCVPGESYLPIMDAIHDEPSIKLISARHEGGASFMAEGYAKSSGKPGVLMATRGVGGSNLTIGVHTAHQDSTPMVVFLGQVHSQFRGREGFQEVDLDQYFRHIAKWTVEIRDAKRVPELVQRAFRVAQTGRPGPVVVSLPEDLLIKESVMAFGPPVRRPTPSPSSDEVGDVEKLLQSSESPLIIAGGGVKASEAEGALKQFAEKYKIPVMASFRRHDVMPNDHPLYLGHLGLGTHKSILETVQQSDVILAFGTRLSEVTTQDYSIITDEKKLVHVDIEYDSIGKIYQPDIGIVADLKEGLHALLSINLLSSWEDWAVTRRRVYENVTSLTNKDVDNHNFHTQIIQTLQAQLPKNAILTNDAGNFAGWLHTFFQFTERNTYVGPTSGAMGYGMPAALGTKLAHPHRTVLSLSGDGGFMMTMQEIETAVRYNIPIISIVFNNKMYGTIRMHQEMHYPFKPIGTELGSVPFTELAQSIGANGYFVRTIKEFELAIERAVKSDKPVVIEIESDPNQISVSSTIEEIRNQHK
ncbi:acetolactate synthase [Pontibacillus chungwhensis BH030062]|uniref:Acetolactate synthase n=1 Tax=Pontibacillus chungwhensis BH030062 TaxID=1385513 RepID=A0A0A2VHB1_9BACI|nr:thiamine pyrophosphate-binding protein [Pontibacillus chungwhensis]KGP93010.1 acetolactate synthase [Pontibacillus chungwhensis BH030062]